MDIREKLRVMLPHWIEHNRGHAEEFARWSQELDDHDSDLAAMLARAVTALEEAHKALEETLSRAGGPLEQGDGQHRHGGHHHHHH